MNNDIEVWKDIQGYEDKYQISSYGRVRSKERTVDRGKYGLLKVHAKDITLRQKENGYFIVGLYSHNKEKNAYVHRLVAQAFIPNPNNLPTVNHKDGNKKHNFVSNLEWASYSDNNQHAYNHGLTHSNKNNSHMSKKIEAYDLAGNLKYTFPSMREAERKLRLSNGTVHMAIKKGWHYAGLVWKLRK